MYNVTADLDKKKLEKALREIPKKVDEATERSARIHLDDLVNNWLNQTGSGRWYRSGRGNSMHRASAPGEPPAPDTNTYRNSWEMEKITEHVYHVFTPDKRGPILELGSEDMDARPHARPAADKHREVHTKIIKDLLKREFN